ncbi:unnamed protein product [Sphagnum tenellum]
MESTSLLQQTALIVTAQLSNSIVPIGQVSNLIRDVYSTLNGLATGTSPSTETATARPIPAVPIRNSITPNYIVCLEDGRQMRTLKRHLYTVYNLTPDQYRARWELPASYPMTAPNYTKMRSEMAKQIGLGRLGRRKPIVETKGKESIEQPIIQKIDPGVSGLKRKYKRRAQ